MQLRRKYSEHLLISVLIVYCNQKRIKCNLSCIEQKKIKYLHLMLFTECLWDILCVEKKNEVFADFSSNLY